MQKSCIAAVLLGALAITPPAYSRDTQHMMPIQDAMSSPDFKAKLDPNIKLYFGNQHHSSVRQTLLKDVVTNKKTNAFAKADEKACRWAFLSALLALQQRAVQEGGNAVINIDSFYKRHTFTSTSEYECHAGAIIAGVALKGDIVKLR